MEGRSLEEELLKHVMHEVATSLTVILCHAQLLELEVGGEATAHISERATKPCSGREQNSVEMIIHQVHQIDQLMMMMADAAGLPGTRKDEDEYA